ncbi:hypothetical protein C8Q73DRAFT_684822 [Cubamyces lactineus]|nr:hypothetical protein C8Q73DRAFT_684822 [Cubamyces lactineus]
MVDVRKLLLLALLVAHPHHMLSEIPQAAVATIRALHSYSPLQNDRPRGLAAHARALFGTVSQYGINLLVCLLRVPRG